MAPNQMDVAREAGVSSATVSRVVNDDPAVIEPTKGRVLAAMKRLNYTPNAAARQLALRKSENIGVVITQVAGGFFGSVMQGISVSAQRQGYATVFTVPTVEDRERNIYRNLMEQSKVDGLAILEPWINENRIADLEKLDGPIVLIQQNVVSEKLSSISIDNFRSARTGMEYLLRRGGDRFLVIRGPEAAQDAQDRERGCRAAIEAEGEKAPRVDFIDGHFHPERALESFRDYLKDHEMPCVIFALNDAMAIAILKELHRARVDVPGQVAVMGFDGIEAADFFDLTTVTTPITEMGEKAVEMLCERIADSSLPARHIMLQGEISVRATT